MFINNGKHGGGGLHVTPVALMNDGLLDFIFFDGKIRAYHIPKLIKEIIF